MAVDLPLLPTMGVGSYASPGWFVAFRRQMRDGGAGPDDIREALDDATRIAVLDQISAGVDILTDGELRRQRFVYEMFDTIEGLERLPPQRRLGVPGYDMAPHFRVTGQIASPSGFGVVEDFKLLQKLAPGRALKVAIPGPLTFAMPLEAGGRASETVIADIVAMVRGEVLALAEAGADYIQLDEPALPHPPLGLDHKTAAAMINAAAKGFAGKLAVHVCFGNNAGRPMADRRFGRIMEAMMLLNCHQLVLEFANRQMADVELLEQLSERFAIAAGVVDVKSFHLESPALVAERIRQCLKFVPAENLSITGDCGFSALPRFLARQKMEAMVAGAALVRENP
jgi:5-methyltetrahydropteroyltriglutamate--homocysteine methyltransferase